MKYAVSIGLLTCVGTLAVLAHSGGLDRNGGHTNRKTGEYHTHQSAAKSPKSVKVDTRKPTPPPISATTAEQRLNDYWRSANTGLVNTPLSAVNKRDVSATLRNRVLDRDGNKCVVCGDSTAALEVDHKRGLQNGGDNSFGNLATLCNPCHKAKTAMDTSLRRKREKLN